MPTFRNDVKLGTKVPLIKTDDLDDRCVTEEKLADGCVSADKIAQDAITADKIAVGSIGTEKLADGAVTADKIAQDAVAADKIAQDAVTAEKIAVGSIGTEKLADGCVTVEKLDGNITSDIKNDVAEKTYEKMKEKFLPLTGGTIEGEERTTGKTIVTLGSQPQTILKGGSIVVKKSYLRKPNLGTTYPPGTSMLNIEDTVSISEKSIIGLQSETATSGWDKSNLKFQIDKDGVQANGFKTISQNIQGLLANDGSIATAISVGDIDEMFNR